MKVELNPHALEGDQPPTPEQFRRRGQHDAAADAEWFQGHPGATERTRQPTPAEVAEHKLPPGSSVVVKRFSDATQLRLFLLPKPRPGA